MPTAIPCAVLMCHAPIVLPDVAGSRAVACAASTRAMIEAAAVVASERPDVVVVLSPHTPRQHDAWGIISGPSIAGTFARFGVPQLGVELPVARGAASLIEAEATEARLSVRALPSAPLDHGALVPLQFVHDAGFRGPTVVIAFPTDPRHDECAKMGEAIARAAARSGERWVVVASGDMSHRLLPDAPAGYHPDARQFDQLVSRAVAAGDFRGAIDVDPQLRELAAEDVIDSLEVAAAAVGFDARGHRVLSYEGPFGVGYLVAILHHPGPSVASSRRILLRIAREAIAAHLDGVPYHPRKFEVADVARPVFVTLWGPARGSDGSAGERELRGCVGHLEATEATLAEEVSACAVASASRDRRMESVTVQELGELTIEISVLGELEPAPSLADLDPQRYGVLVTQGARRGVLLPNVEGVDSARSQVTIACRKGDIDLDRPFAMQRFLVEKIAE